ncbi:Conserved_hypothetical protein [Hexamita inflata]|uniref:Uncharacterized protein n=1 Tax=Hexamita inflata TaxID=28002 RepID=A0AA86TAF3_9EUKA|nr:Conserved hypothetical protein [Hexamita inflata]
MELTQNNSTFYCINQKSSQYDAQIQYQSNLKINTVYFPSLHLVPVNITKLIASNCCLQSISSLRIFTKLDYLDISDNFIGNISDLQFLQNLQYLNMSNNRIIFPDPLATLKSLKKVITDGNKIQNFEPLTQNPNFDVKWISPQNDAELQDFRDYLGFGSTEQESQELMEKTLELKKLSYFNSPILQKYSQQVQNKTLMIRGDQDIQSLKFVDFMEVDTLFVLECYNASFVEVPANIKKLVVNRCRLESASGLEYMSQLEELSLRGNKLTELGALTQIKTLKILDVAQNNIKSLENIEQLQQLVELDASENTIESVEPLETMKQLQRLNLSTNKISSGSSLEDLTNLVQLNVAFNSLESIYFVRNMELLTHLDISFNKVQDILVLMNLLKILDLRLDGNFISMFTALENHPNKQLGWFTCKQNVKKEDRQINIIDNFLQQPGNQKCIIENDQKIERLDFVDIVKPNELFISGCPNIKFEHAVKIPTTLTVTKCGLSEITDIHQMNQITWLDLSFNKIMDISELAELVDLTYLNLESNDIYRIDALAELQKLEFLNLTNNKIIFSYPIYKLKVSKLLIENNLIVDQAYENQGIPTLADSKNYLGPNNTQQQVDEFKVLTDFSLNQVQMLRKYRNTVFNNTLTLKNDNDPQSFEFIKKLNINTLSIENCQNIQYTFRETKQIRIQNNYINSLQAPPANLVLLTINKCNISNVFRLAQMKQLKYLDLRSNSLISISPLKQLINLKQVLIDDNLILDLDILTTLPNYHSDWIQIQRIPKRTDIQTYLSDTKQNITIDEFKANLAQNIAKTEALIEQFPISYDKSMIKKYKNNVYDSKDSEYMNGQFGKALTIRNDINLRDLKFVEHLGVIQLQIIGCKNVQLYRVPTNLKLLMIKESNLKSIKGVERLTELNYLELINNNIVNVNGLRELNQLERLYLNGNSIVDFSAVKYLQSKGCCKMNCFTNNQKQPTQQEIEEAII